MGGESVGKIGRIVGNVEKNVLELKGRGSFLMIYLGKNKERFIEISF